MAAPLRDAALRFNRGRQHVIELKTRFKRWLDENPEPVTVRANPPQGPVVDQGPSPPFAEWAVLVGDAINDFRSALEYLVHGLVRLDSDREVGKTQFPIADSPQHFSRLRRRFLRGMSEKHVSRIEAVQPYQGSNWLAELRRLSNLDKHRHLPRLGIRFSRVFQVSGPPAKGSARESGEIEFVEQVHQSDAIEARLLLEDDTDLLEVLSSIQRGTYDLLMSFRSDFPGEQLD